MKSPSAACYNHGNKIIKKKKVMSFKVVLQLLKAFPHLYIVSHNL